VICPLCSSPNSQLYHEDKFRTFHLCQDCSLVFVPREKILAFDEEAARYEAHENDEFDPGYRNYMEQTASGIRHHLPASAHGLDFGCGKTLILSKIFKSYGIDVDSYDLYFHPKEEIWSKKYDFVVLSEVIEHLKEPSSLMVRLSGILNPHGQIFVKTKLYPPEPEAFSNWFYKRDLTHVQFFSYGSLKTLADQMGMQGPLKGEAPDLYWFKS
jgi:hypothetical protein